MGFLTEIARQIGSGERSPVELAQSCLEAIRRRDDDIRAWAHIDAKAVLEDAKRLGAEIQKKGPRSPLHGVPVGIKDIFDVDGLPCEWGSPLYKGRMAEGDAGLVAELRRLGAVILGKTHTTGFAYFDPGPTRNPRNLAHTPGGSSSGSAAAVAAGMAPLTLGSQTMGSVLRPASFCGVVGFKPTFGRLSLEGVLPFAPSLDHAGLFTADADDMAFVWRALTGEEGDAAPEGPIAALPWPPGARTDMVMRQGFAEALGMLARAGFPIEKADPPEEFRALPEAILSLLAWEAAEIHHGRFEQYGEKLGAKLAELIRRGRKTPEVVYDQARQMIDEAAEAYASLMKKYPLTLTPAAMGVAPGGLSSTGEPRANAPWTALGVPAVSIPMARTREGLPLGLQISAARGADAGLLAAASAMEEALGDGASLASATV